MHRNLNHVQKNTKPCGKKSKQNPIFKPKPKQRSTPAKDHDKSEDQDQDQGHDQDKDQDQERDQNQNQKKIIRTLLELNYAHDKGAYILDESIS